MQVRVEEEEGEDEGVDDVYAAVHVRRGRGGVARPEALAEGVQNAIYLLRLGAQEELVAQHAKRNVDALSRKVKLGHVQRPRELLDPPSVGTPGKSISIQEVHAWKQHYSQSTERLGNLLLLDQALVLSPALVHELACLFLGDGVCLVCLASHLTATARLGGAACTAAD